MTVKRLKQDLTKNKESKLIDLTNEKKLNKTPKNSKSKDVSSNKKLKSSNSPNTKYNMRGGNVIRAVGDMVNSMTALGRSIFGEIQSIKNIPADINNVASATPIPNNNLKVPK